MARPSPALMDLATGRSVSPDTGIVASAIEHRMGGLLLAAHESGAVSVPARELTALTASDLATGAWHRQLWQTLATVVTTLAERDLDVLAIKGVANEARWYRRLGERPCTDVDIVLAPHCVDRVDEVVVTLAPEVPTGALTTLVRRRQLQHVHFNIADVAVDLHLDPFKLGIWTRNNGLWWDSSEWVEAPDGTRIRVLAPELALVGALTHLNKDRFACLGAYVEVARIVADPGLDWDRLVHFVAAEGLDIPVWASLAEVVTRLGLDLSVPAAGGWRRLAFERLWPPSVRLRGHDAADLGRKRQLMIPLLVQGRRREALAELRRSVVPPRELIEVHGDEFADHSYLRRITVDRVVNR